MSSYPSMTIVHLSLKAAARIGFSRSCRRFTDASRRSPVHASIGHCDSMARRKGHVPARTGQVLAVRKLEV
eukprot:6197536-Pleurochrysis_carterae.AAC.11